MRAFSLILATVSVLTAQSPKYCEIKAPTGQASFEVERIDVNGDGVQDLVMQVAIFKEPVSRALRIHLRPTDGSAFKAEPDQIIPLATWDTGFLAVRTGAGQACKFLALNRLGVFRTAEGGETGALAPLVPSEFMFQVPEAWRAISFQHLVVDLNGDGRDDLVLPEDGGVRVALQSAPAEGVQGVQFERSVLLRAPVTLLDLQHHDRMTRGAFSNRGRGFTVALGVGSQGRGPLVDFADSVHVPQWVDWNSDGKLDILQRSASMLHIWQQGDAGFAESPTRSLPFPIQEDLGLRLDLSWAVEAADLDGDQRSDLVVSSRNVYGEGSLIQVFLARGQGPLAGSEEHPLFGPEGVPVQVIPLANHAVGLHLQDVDSDGLKDIVVAGSEGEARGLFGGGGDEGLALKYMVFRNQGGGAFSKQADVLVNLKVGVERLRDLNHEVGARFFIDLNGDAIRDLLVRVNPGRFELRASNRTGQSSFEVSDQVLQAMDLGHESTPMPFPAEGGQGAEFWAWNKEGVKCWSF